VSERVQVPVWVRGARNPFAVAAWLEPFDGSDGMKAVQLRSRASATGHLKIATARTRRYERRYVWHLKIFGVLARSGDRGMAVCPCFSRSFVRVGLSVRGAVVARWRVWSGLVVCACRRPIHLTRERLCCEQ
jgi:hypothetical protein